MTGIDRRGVARVLARIKTFHAPQDIGEAVISSWVDAFAYANITNATDAEAAVIRHYTTPGANQWITPGDVVGHYRAIRNERLAGISDGDLTPDLPGDASGLVYVRTHRARQKAVADGLTVQEAIATVAPVRAIEARR